MSPKGPGGTVRRGRAQTSASLPLSAQNRSLTNTAAISRIPSQKHSPSGRCDSSLPGYASGMSSARDNSALVSVDLVTHRRERKMGGRSCSDAGGISPSALLD